MKGKKVNRDSGRSVRSSIGRIFASVRPFSIAQCYSRLINWLFTRLGSLFHFVPFFVRSTTDLARPAAAAKANEAVKSRNSQIWPKFLCRQLSRRPSRRGLFAGRTVRNPLNVYGSHQLVDKAKKTDAE